MSKTPVTIIAGFLGSGKTTLLNNIISAEHGLKIAVLVNDFGEINIDSKLITNVEGETISLANGCVCCTIRDDLAKAVSELCDSDENYDYIVTETSGVSEPAAAAMGLVMPPQLSAKIQIDAIITVVDAEQVLQLEGEHRHLATDQVETADIVIINKTDLVSEQILDDVRQWIAENAPAARMLETSYGKVPVDIVINTMASSRQQADHYTHHHEEHDHGFSTWTLSETRPLSFQAVYELFKNLPLAVYRAKGFLNLAEVPDKQVILQMVGKRVTLSKGPAWTTQGAESEIVMIAASRDFDVSTVRADFSACIADGQLSTDNRLAGAVIEILRM